MEGNSSILSPILILDMLDRRRVGLKTQTVVVGVVAFLSQKLLIIHRRGLSENKILTICTTELRPNFAGRVFFSFDFLIFVVVTSPYL